MTKAPVKKVVKPVITKKVSKVSQPKSATPSIDADFLQLIARDQYIISLVNDAGGKRPRMPYGFIPASNFDRDCAINKSNVKKTIEILLNYGVIKLEDLKVPDGVPIKAVDVETDGIPRWIKNKFFKKENKDLLEE